MYLLRLSFGQIILRGRYLRVSKCAFVQCCQERFPLLHVHRIMHTASFPGYFAVIYSQIVFSFDCVIANRGLNFFVVYVIFVSTLCFKFLKTRPANVPEGAYILWEIELLGFETPKVISLAFIK